MAFVCINCGHPASELYKQYSPSVLKLTECVKCRNTVDKYIEFETLIIILDLLLLSRPAYRHVIYNTVFRVYWKILVILCLMEACVIWTEKEYDAEDGFSKEKQFYIYFGLVAFGNGLLVACIMTLNFIWRLVKPTDFKPSCETVLKAFVLASIVKFLTLPIYIWRENSTNYGILIHNILILIYFATSLTFVYSTLYSIPKIFLGIIFTSLIVVKHIIMSNLTLYIELLWIS